MVPDIHAFLWRKTFHTESLPPGGLLRLSLSPAGPCVHSPTHSFHTLCPANQGNRCLRFWKMTLNLSMRTLLPVKPLSLVTAVLLQRGVQRVSFIQMCTERLLWARAFSRHYRLADFFLTLAWNQHDYHLSFSLQNRQVTSDDELGCPGSNVPAVPSCPCPSELRWSSRWAQHTSEIPHWAWNHLPYWFLAIKYHWRPAPVDLLLGVLQERTEQYDHAEWCPLPHTCDNMQSTSSLSVPWWCHGEWSRHFCLWRRSTNGYLTMNCDKFYTRKLGWYKTFKHKVPTTPGWSEADEDWAGRDFPGGPVLQGTQVRSLVQELRSTCQGATKPSQHNYSVCVSESPCSTMREACSPQLEETCRPQWRPNRGWHQSISAASQMQCWVLKDPVASRACVPAPGDLTISCERWTQSSSFFCTGVDNSGP